DLQFETLKQICLEPASRVQTGREIPTGSLPSDTINSVSVMEADWLKTTEIPINSGLVAIIGARGSGKTALVEIIAAGSGSVDNNHTKNSFLKRAQNYLVGSKAELKWGNNEIS